MMKDTKTLKSLKSKHFRKHNTLNNNNNSNNTYNLGYSDSESFASAYQYIEGLNGSPLQVH